jgi:hypothetical protein
MLSEGVFIQDHQDSDLISSIAPSLTSSTGTAEADVLSAFSDGRSRRLLWMEVKKIMKDRRSRLSDKISDCVDELWLSNELSNTVDWPETPFGQLLVHTLKTRWESQFPGVVMGDYTRCWLMAMVRAAALSLFLCILSITDCFVYPHFRLILLIPSLANFAALTLIFFVCLAH